MIIKIQGGLGNQMFQYAYGRKQELAKRSVFFDVSFFNKGRANIDTARDFKLDNFNIGTGAKFLKEKHRFADLYNGIKRKLGFKQEGFYQSEKYFKNIQAIIRQEFTLKNPLSKVAVDWQEKIKNAGNSVSIHIRRGDYVADKKTNAFHGVCDMDYYDRALKKIAEGTGNEKIRLFVFSDDIGWAKENLSYPYPTFFVSDPQIPDYEEMYLMSVCKHNIIANSSFSWWGAWLNRNADKVVVAPKQWFANMTVDQLDILPQNWIRI